MKGELDFPPEEQERRDRIKMRCLLAGFLALTAGGLAYGGENWVFWSYGPNVFSWLFAGLALGAAAIGCSCFWWAYSAMRTPEFSLKKERRKLAPWWAVVAVLGAFGAALMELWFYSWLRGMGISVW